MGVRNSVLLGYGITAGAVNHQIERSWPRVFRTYSEFSVDYEFDLHFGRCTEFRTSRLGYRNPCYWVLLSGESPCARSAPAEQRDSVTSAPGFYHRKGCVLFHVGALIFRQMLTGDNQHHERAHVTGVSTLIFWGGEAWRSTVPDALTFDNDQSFSCLQNGRYPDVLKMSVF